MIIDYIFMKKGELMSSCSTPYLFVKEVSADVCIKIYLKQMLAKKYFLQMNVNQCHGHELSKY